MRVSPQAIVSPLPAKDDGVPRMLRSATSAFTRVFDALWPLRRGALLIRGRNGTPVLGTVPALRSGMKNAAPRPGHGLIPVKTPSFTRYIKPSRGTL
jgi:hypothetical protein